MGAQIPLLPGVLLAPSFLENLPSNADASHPNLTRQTARWGQLKHVSRSGGITPGQPRGQRKSYPSCHESRAGIRPFQALRGVARVNPSGQPKGRRGGEGGAVVKATARSVPDRTIAQAAQGGVVQPNQAQPSRLLLLLFLPPPSRLERSAGARQAASESEPADRRKRGRGGSRERRRRRRESQLGGRPPSSRSPRLGDKGGERRQESSEDGLARGAEHDAAWGRPRPGSRRLRGLPGVARLEEAEAERGRRRRRGRGPTDFSLAEPALAAAMM